MYTFKFIKKTLILVLLACLFFSVSLFLFSNAYAYDFDIENAYFCMSKYTSIRQGDNINEVGIKYSVAMRKDHYDEFMAQKVSNNSKGKYSEISFGLTIVPVDYIEENPITESTLFGANDKKKYYWGEDDFSLETLGLKKIILFETDRLAQLDEFEKAVVGFYGSIINIKDGTGLDKKNNIARDFNAVGFIKYKTTDSNNYKYIFTENIYFEENSTLKIAPIGNNIVCSAAELAYKEISNRKTSEERKNFLQNGYLDKVLLNIVYLNDNGETLESTTIAYADNLILTDYIPNPKLPENVGLEFECWYVDGKKYDLTKRIFENLTLTPKFSLNSNFNNDISDISSPYQSSLFYDNVTKYDNQDYTIGLDFEKNYATDKWIKIDAKDWNDYDQVSFAFCALNLDSYSYPHIKVGIAGLNLTPIWDHYFYVVTATKQATDKFPCTITSRKGTNVGEFDFTKYKDFLIYLSVEKSSVNQGFRISQFVGSYKIDFDSKGGSAVESSYVVKNSKLLEPTAPQKYGFIFKYWMKDGVKYDFNQKVMEKFTLEAYYEIDPNPTPILIDFSKPSDLSKVSASLYDGSSVTTSVSSSISYGTESSSLMIQVPVATNVNLNLNSAIWQQCKEVKFNITHTSINSSARFLCADLSKSIWNKSDNLGNYGYQLYVDSSPVWVEVKVINKSNGLFDLYYNNFLRAQNVNINQMFPILFYFSATDVSGITTINYHVSNVVCVPEI